MGDYYYGQPYYSAAFGQASYSDPVAATKKSSFGVAEGPLSNKFILILVIFAAIAGLVFFLFWLTGSVESPASTDTADSFGESTDSFDGSTASSQS